MRIRIALHWQMLGALALAVAAGVLLRGAPADSPALAALGVAGTIFLRLLKMIVLPLVMASLVCGMAGLGEAGKIGRVGLKTAAYYLGTTALAAATGLVLVNVIGPGRGGQLQLPEGPPELAAPRRFGELLTGIVPENIFQAFAQFDMLGVIFFSLVFGLALNFASGQARSRVLPVVEAVLEVMMRVTRFVILLAPVGVFALVAKLVAQLGVEALRSLLPYAATVAGGLAVHFFGTLPVLAFGLARVNPYRLMRRVSAALCTAFSTASSSATLPVTVEQAERRAGVSKRIAGFVLPLGATVNMDGTALYECVAVMFLAQALGVELSVVQQAAVFVGAVLVSIGAAGIPHAGLVMMTVILSAVGLPVEAAAMVWAVDRPLDMCRTTVNVWSDVVGSVVVAASEQELDRARLTGSPVA